MKNIDIDKIRLRKFEGEKPYFFAGYGNTSIQISKETFDKIELYQMRTLKNPESAQFILSMIEEDEKKFGKHSKN